MLKKALQLYIESFLGLSKSIWLLSLMMLINRTGTMVIPFMTIYLTQELQMGLVEAGYVMACFGAGSVLGSYLGGLFTDKIGYYKTMFWSLLLGGAMFMVLMYMDGLFEVCLTVFIMSTIAESFRPAGITAITAYSTEANRTRSFSLIRLAINLGFTAGPALGGFLAANVGFSWLFIIDGITCMLGGFFLLIFLSENEVVAEQEEVPTTVEVKKAASVYKDHIYMVFLLLNLLSAIAFMQLIHVTPVYFRQELLLTEGQIGALMALNGFIIAILEMPIVYTIEKKLPTLIVVCIGTLLIGLSYLIFTFPGAVIWIAVLSILAITFGEILGMPFSNTFAASRSSVHNRGQYMALFTMSYSISHIVAPLMGMFIAEHYGFNMLWIMLTVLSIFAGFGFVWLNARKDLVSFQSTPSGSAA